MQNGGEGEILTERSESGELGRVCWKWDPPLQFRAKGLCGFEHQLWPNHLGLQLWTNEQVTRGRPGWTDARSIRSILGSADTRGPHVLLCFFRLADMWVSWSILDAWQVSWRFG
jgi:hypothetical protein